MWEHILEAVPLDPESAKTLPKAPEDVGLISKPFGSPDALPDSPLPSVLASAGSPLL